MLSEDSKRSRNEKVAQNLEPYVLPSIVTDCIRYHSSENSRRSTNPEIYGLLITSEHRRHAPKWRSKRSRNGKKSHKALDHICSLLDCHRLHPPPQFWEFSEINQSQNQWITHHIITLPARAEMKKGGQEMRDVGRFAAEKRVHKEQQIALGSSRRPEIIAEQIFPNLRKIKSSSVGDAVSQTLGQTLILSLSTS